MHIEDDSRPVARFTVELYDDGTMRWTSLDTDPGGWGSILGSAVSAPAAVLVGEHGPGVMKLAAPKDETAAAVETVKAVFPGSTVDEAGSIAATIEDQIKAAKTVEDLNNVYRNNSENWTPEHNVAAGKRKRELSK